MLFVDQMILDEAPRRTADGYLVAMPRVARTGIQDYAGFEVGRPDMERVKVYRPEAEVFSKDALKSFTHRPVTVDHPPVLVDANNWKKYSRGTTGGDVARDGEFIRVPMSLMDEAAINDVLAGKVELSMGYTADLVWDSGTTPEGEQYDAIQTNIRGNHLAVVDAARGGAMLRVIDTNQPKESVMTLKKIVVDGISVEVTDTAAEVVSKALSAADAKEKNATDRIKQLEDELAELKKDKGTKDAEIATLKQQVADAALTPQKLDAAVAARAAVVDSAKGLLKTVVVDGKTEVDIMRQVVADKLGDTCKEWDDSQIKASFNTLAVAAPAADPVRAVITGDGKAKVTAYDAYVSSISNAYKAKQEA
jgi:hypothetical protein